MDATPGQSAAEHRREPVGTEYRGPVVVTSIDVMGCAVKLVRPADPDQLLDDPRVIDWNRQDDYMPYWAFLWPAAYLLAEGIARESWPAGTAESGPVDALEIGCGLGLAGLVAVARGLRVHFTDYDPGPLGFVRRSAAANGFEPSRYSTGLLDWRDLPEERYSVILGADVLYESRLLPLVAALMRKMLAPGGVGLIASPYRVAAKGFPDAIAQAGLTCQAEVATARAEDGTVIDGTIYRVTR